MWSLVGTVSIYFLLDRVLIFQICLFVSNLYSVSCFFINFAGRNLSFPSVVRNVVGDDVEIFIFAA